MLSCKLEMQKSWLHPVTLMLQINLNKGFSNNILICGLKHKPL
jgi:hypothetical protein